MLRRRLHAEWLLVAILACAFVIAASAGRWFAAADNRIYDLASALAAPAADERILVVEIDEPSLRQFGRWPWPRTVHARALNRLADYRPAAVAYDVLFLDPSADDAALHEALQRAGNVYLPALAEQDADGAYRLQPPVPAAASGAGGVGIAQLLPDEDGVLRRAERALPIGGKNLAQLPTLLAAAQSPSAKLKRPDDRRFLIGYAGADAFRRISFASLANGEVPADLVRGKLVLVGATAPGMGDSHVVPAGAGHRLYGVEVQANIANTLLRDAAIASPGVWSAAAAAIVPLLLLLVGFLRLPPGRNLVLAAALAVGTVVLAVLLLPVARLWLPPAATVAGLVVTHALWGWRRLAATNRFLAGQADALLREPGVHLPSDARGAGGDVIEAEALRLEAVIGQVRHLRRFISQVIERFPDAVFVVGADDRVLLSNEAASGLVGASMVGRPIGDVLQEIGGDNDLVRGPIRHRSGRSLLMAEAPIDAAHRIVSFADITELQRAADERDDLLQFLSHDLRSPNAAIVWLLESEKLDASAPRQEEVPRQLRDKIMGYARHGLRLADNFVQLVRARRRPLAREPVDLSDVAREAADMVAPYARIRGTRLQNESDSGELWVTGDQGMLLRAAINLLENAVKFAPDNAAVVFAVTRDSDHVIFSVIGPGPTMPAGRQADPFALYAEGRPADGQGSIGLGLSFVQTTAQRHDGQAKYIYREGFGAEFQIVLPLAQLDD